VTTSLSRDEQFDLELLRSAVRYQRWVVSAFEPISGAVVEIGAGSGNFTRWLARTADRVVAVEPHEALADRLEGLRLPNVEVVRSRIEAFPDSGSFDLALAFNVLEHIEDDGEAVRAMARLVRPGGRVGVLVPAHQALYGALDRRYHHLRRYSRRSVADLLAGAGLEVGTVRYVNPLGALGWLIAVRLLGRRKLSRASIWLSEWIAVPVSRALDRAGVRPFGQSVIALARRPP
jgi:SAM-dependent methyltransferase